MIKFILYLLETSALLGVFYLFYILIMKKETFFNLNRFFLLGIVVFSFLFPLMSFDFSQGEIALLDRPVKEFSNFRINYHEVMETWDSESATDPISFNESVESETTSVGFNWVDILIKIITGIYLIGVLVCLSKMCFAVRWLRKMIKTHPQELINKVNVVKIPDPVAPFSFFKYAFIHKGIIDSPELDQIIAHEKVHIEQRHSVDLIFVQFLASFLWFNPLIWKLIKSLKTTHEYITDNKVINTGYSLVEYQTLLLKQLISNNSYGLVHNFNISYIKKRIIMMKSNKSGFTGKVKVALTIICASLLSLVVVQCNSKIDEATADELELEEFIKKHNVKVRYMSRDSMLLIHPEFTISDDKLLVNEKSCEIGEIKSFVEHVIPHGLIDLRIDRNQSMKKVREIQEELRRLNKRKIVYHGETAAGKQMIQPFLIPPLHWADTTRDDSIPPNINLNNATIVDNVATLNGIEFLKLNLSSDAKINYKEEVYNFVKKHVDKGSMAYVIRAEFDDNDTFENYLTNLADVFQGFEKIFRVRAQELFDKDFDEVKGLEYSAVVRDVPKAVYVAGR